MNHPAVSFLYEPEDEVYSGSETDPEIPSPAMSTVASWGPDLSWAPAEEESFSVLYETSEPSPDLSLPPPPPLYQAGELANYENNFEHGDSEMETEEFSFMPPLPPEPYPGPAYQAGELSKYASVFEHGNEESETEEQGFVSMVPPGAELSLAPMSEGLEQPVAQELGPLGPNEYYLFLTGQLPPGTVTHFQSDYKTSRDHWGEVHYERYHYPVAPHETTPTQQVSSDELWQQLQYDVKA